MKKRILIISFFTVIITVCISVMNTTNASASLPDNGNAGAPMDNSGQTCTSCHAGTATQTTGVIFTDIPSNGYMPGVTYNFTVTMSGALAYGFEMTPQTATSNVGLGTWIAGSGTAVSSKYIKQSAKKTGTSATWTFQWTAPTTATTVTFYGAFNYANNNNNTLGDVIKKSSVTYFSNTTDIRENNTSAILISVFPNPTNKILHFLTDEQLSQAMIYSVDGKLIKVLSEQELISKYVLVDDLLYGQYFLYLKSNTGKNFTAKFIKN